MSEFDKMDQLFRDNLGDLRVEPRTETWKQISFNLLWRELTRFNFTNISAGYLGVGGGILVGVLFLSYFLIYPSKQEIQNKVNSLESHPYQTQIQSNSENQLIVQKKDSHFADSAENIISENAISSSKTIENEPVLNEPIFIVSDTKKDMALIENENEVTVNTPGSIVLDDFRTPIPTVSENLSIQEITPVSGSIDQRDELKAFYTPAFSQPEINTIDSLEPEKIIVEKSVAEPESLLYTEEESTVIANASGSHFKRTQQISRIKSLGLGSLLSQSAKPMKNKYKTGVPGKKKYGIESFFSTSAYVSTELMDYKINGKDQSMVYLAGITGDYNILDFIFQSGFEISVTEDRGAFDVKYLTRDSVGFYLNPLPTGDTAVITVFDSVLHSENPLIGNRYTYLNIPISVGYRFYGANRIVGIAKGGMTISTLIDKFEPNLYYNKENAVIQSVENKTLSRYKSNFQIFLGIQFRYLYSEKIDIFVESSYRRFLQSVYDNKAITNQPYSVGIKGGVVIKF